MLFFIIQKLLLRRFYHAQIANESRLHILFWILCCLLFTLHLIVTISFSLHFFYKWVLKHLSCCQTLGWLPPQTLCNKVNSVSWTIGDDTFEGNGQVFRQIDSFFCSLLKTFRPIFRGTQNRSNFIDLINFWVSKKEGFHEVHFGDDASHGKNINWSRIGRKSKEQLGGAIPSGGTIVGEWRFTSDFFGNTKIN